MISEKTLYWAAVGLMVLVLGNHFAKKYDRCLSERSSITLQRLSAEGEHLVAMAQIAMGRIPSVSPDSDAAVARIQGQFASMQARVARQQAACARVEARRARLMAMREMAGMHFSVECPRQRLQVEVPQVQVQMGEGTI